MIRLSALIRSTLVFLETKGGDILPSSLSAVTAAQKLGGPVAAFVAGSKGKELAEKASKIAGVNTVLFLSDAADVEHPIAERLTDLLAELQSKSNYTAIVASASSLSKAALPRLAAKLDVQMLSEVIGIESADTFTRPIYAGNAIAKVKSSDKVKIVTIRPTNFEKAAASGGSATTSAFQSSPPSAVTTKWVSDELARSDRVELTSARVVVAGGRGLGSAENFKILYELADKLKAAVGASRAAVDAGYCSNDMQIGQTGKVVAPELYIAVGISGAIQHLAGMKDSKVIVAINKDAEAPIFQVADYGLVADLFKAVPEITNKVKQ